MKGRETDMYFSVPHEAHLEQEVEIDFDEFDSTTQAECWLHKAASLERQPTNTSVEQRENRCLSAFGYRGLPDVLN